MLTKRYNNALADKLDAEEAAALMEADRDALAAEVSRDVQVTHNRDWGLSAAQQCVFSGGIIAQFRRVWPASRLI